MSSALNQGHVILILFRLIFSAVIIVYSFMIHSDIPKSPQTIDWHGFKHSCAKMIEKIYFGEERKRYEMQRQQSHSLC